MASITTKIAIANLATTERYFKQFVVEMHGDTSGVNRLAVQNVQGVFNSGTGAYEQSAVAYFTGAVVGTTYFFRVAVVDKAGNQTPWVTNGWISAVAGDPTPPSTAYSPGAFPSTGGIRLEANPVTPESDINHYEFFHTFTVGVTPAPTSRATLPISTTGVVNIVMTASESVFVWVRAVDTLGQKQSWVSLGGFSSSGASLSTGLFYETFENDIASLVNVVSGTGAGLTYFLNGQAGGRALGNGGNYYWATYRQNIPYDPSKLYRIRTRIRKYSGAGSTTVYVGMTGVAADGTTYVDATGANSAVNNQHWNCVYNVTLPADGQWHVFTGFVKGVSLPGTTSPSTDPNAPAGMHPSVRYIRPTFILSFASSVGDIYEIDYISIDFIPDSIDHIPDGSIYARVSVTSVSNGFIDPSKTGFLTKGSFSPIGSTSMTYTATTSTITWHWSGLTLYRPDGTTTPIADGSQSIIGLTASTLYYFYPYYDEVTGLIAWAIGTVGSPKLASTAQSVTSAQSQALQYRVPISSGAIVGSTTATGTGGGSGGGSGGCLHGDMLVESNHGHVPISFIAVGDMVMGKDGWQTVTHVYERPCETFLRIELSDGEVIVATPTHPFTLPDGTTCRAQDLTLSHFLITKDGYTPVESIAMLHTNATKVSLTCEPDHMFYAGADEAAILTHNILYQS